MRTPDRIVRAERKEDGSVYLTFKVPPGLFEINKRQAATFRCETCNKLFQSPRGHFKRVGQVIVRRRFCSHACFIETLRKSNHGGNYDQPK
jgi:hypothetical protein